MCPSTSTGRSEIWRAHFVATFLGNRKYMLRLELFDNFLGFHTNPRVSDMSEIWGDFFLGTLPKDVSRSCGAGSGFAVLGHDLAGWDTLVCLAQSQVEDRLVRGFRG